MGEGGIEKSSRELSLFTARVTPTLPKQDRPVREGTRVASVETGLAAAAAKLAQQVNGQVGLLIEGAGCEAQTDSSSGGWPPSSVEHLLRQWGKLGVFQED